MILEIFTLAHVLISLIGIFSGFVVAYGLVNAKQLMAGPRGFCGPPF